MKLTRTLVQRFEQDQDEHGTEVALFNVLWLKAADDLKAIGVKKVTTVIRRDARATRAA